MTLHLEINPWRYAEIEARHGIVLPKHAGKEKGVKTGEALWQAKEKCRDIVFVKPHYDRYLKFSELAQEIYKRVYGSYIPLWN